MFAPANQTHFSLRIENLRHDFQVLAFRGREAISQPFRFDLELVSERSDLDLDALLHQPAFLILSPSGEGPRTAHQHRPGDSGKRLTGYRATLEPRLAYLGLCSDQRIFQRLSVPEIIGRVLEGWHSRRRLPLPAGPDAVPGPRILHAVRRNRPGVPQQALRGGRHPLPP